MSPGLGYKAILIKFTIYIKTEKKKTITQTVSTLNFMHFKYIYNTLQMGNRGI